jgi:hypothetical protein
METSLMLGVAGEVVSQGTMAMLLLEGIKQLLKLITKNPDYELDPRMYVILLPVFSLLAVPLLAVVGWAVMPTDWAGFGREVLQAVIAALASVFIYDKSLRGLKDRVREFRASSRGLG